MSKLLILGAGGHGKVVAEAALLMNQWNRISFLDDKDSLESLKDINVIGKLCDYEFLKDEYKYAFIAFGDNKLRLEWIEIITNAGYLIPVIIHPFSSVSGTCQIGKGTIVMAGVVINASAIVGQSCILNTSSTIDHDCLIDDAVHLSPGVHIAGKVTIGRCSWIGIGANIANNINIGSNVIVAAGSAVTENVSNNVMIAGVPAIIKKQLGEINHE